ncbi:MAG: Coenzyme F420 hydrogenase/dehydrogenase, beta subunit C-terminal domain [Thermodesulfobacteriota bacterium]|nr:Coenzyme F420 hydrogenase/dehydrogenase, beta subunit C-terminal domain [Thermodesulfobacteriota bacterium]
MGIQLSEGQRLLVDEVINKGICVSCGACVGLCPYFDYFDGRVVVMDRCCADTWKCVQLCPRLDSDIISPGTGGPGFAEDGGIGTHRHVVMARACDDEIREKGQYGGVVSALLIYGLETGYIKSAILTDVGGEDSPGERTAENRPDVLSCAGSRYSAAGGLSALNRAIEAGKDGLGIVGLPCQMEALARMGLMKPDGEKRAGCVALKIGLFCTWAVDHRQLAVFLERHGVQRSTGRFDIPPPPAEVFQVQTENGWMDFPLSDIRPLVLKGCALCKDMTAERADISVGAVEGLGGWNTVIVRTEAGLEIFDAAIDAGWLQTSELPEENLEHLKEAAYNKRERDPHG